MIQQSDFSQLRLCLHDFDPKNVEARRIFHGRGHCFPGLDWFVVDYFSPVLFVSVYKAISDETAMHLKQHLLDTAAEVVALQHRYDGYRIEYQRSEIPERWFAVESGLQYQLQTGQQNIGLFLDMQPLRNWLAINCHNKTVLNLFAYTCSLSVAAAKGGARSVVNVDLSSKSLAKGQLNHHLNKLANTNVKYMAHNIFKSWGKIKKHGPYDVIIVDPPSFQKGSFVMAKDYGRLLKRLSELAADKAIIFLTLNEPNTSSQWLLDLVKQLGINLEFISLMPRAPGFKEKHPDAGLKVLKMQLKS